MRGVTEFWRVDERADMLRSLTGEQLVFGETNATRVRLDGTRDVFSAEGRLVQIKHPQFGVVELVYDDRALLAARRWSDGSVEHIARESTGTVRLVPRSFCAQWHLAPRPERLFMQLSSPRWRWQDDRLEACVTSNVAYSPNHECHQSTVMNRDCEPDLSRPSFVIIRGIRGCGFLQRLCYVTGWKPVLREVVPTLATSTWRSASSTRPSDFRKNAGDGPQQRRASQPGQRSARQSGLPLTAGT
jgi:YD repeat-containing protein